MLIVPPAHAKETPKRRGFWSALSLVLGAFLMLGGVVLLTGNAVAPEKTEEIIYGAKTIVEGRVEKAKEAVTGEYPTIYLEGSGGMYELDTAYDRQFVHLPSYDTVEGVPQTWAAHNGLGGSTIIPWEVGQHLNVVGSGLDGVWVVVDYSDIDKFGAVSQAAGLQGDLALQTCHWGVPIVRFVGIVPLEVYENDWPPNPQSGERPQSNPGSDVSLIVED